jgi:hypothetical protein
MLPLQDTFKYMTQLEWFRQTTWTNEIEKDFEQRLARSRGQRAE